MKVKFLLAVFFFTAAAWLTIVILKNIETGSLIEFGTIQFRNGLTVEQEQGAYAALAEYSAIGLIAYPLTILSAAGYIMTTHRSVKREGWLLMSAIMLFIFIPVELYCFWLDWKLIGLQYWGEWPIEEFRAVFLNRVTALAGLPFIAQLCYFTIPIFIIFKPLQKKEKA